MVESYLDAAEFYLNKVRVAYRGKNDDHMKFCALFKESLQLLLRYVKSHHKMGVAWNPRGKDPESYSPAVSASQPAAGAKASAQATSAAPSGGMTAVFAQLSKIDQSSGKTAGLRHVTKDMKSAKSAAAATTSKPAP